MNSVLLKLTPRVSGAMICHFRPTSTFASVGILGNFQSGNVLIQSYVIMLAKEEMTGSFEQDYSLNPETQTICVLSKNWVLLTG